MQISTGTKVPTNCVENSTGTTAQNYCYKVCLTPESAKSDFMFMKSYSPSTPRNNAAKEAENLAWSSQSRGSSANNGATTPNELKQDNTNWALTKNQTSTLKSYNSVNMDGTLMRKVMQTDSENYVNPVATGQYWTWGTRMRECKMPSPATGLPERAWTPRYTPTKTPQQQQPSGQSHGHPPPDYHHNVYIPGTPSALCTLRPSNRSELDVHNTFSTFGKKRKFISPSSYDPRDETVTIKLSTVETALKSYADMTEVPLEYDIFSDLNLYLVIGLGSVSFLLLITILVTIVLKCQKPKPSKAAPPCRNSVISERNSTIADSTLVSNDAYWNSVISERNSTIADSTLVSNDAYWYSLFLAETRKGKLVVRQPVPKGTRYIVSSIPRSTGLTETSDSAASTLQSLDREVQAIHNLILTAVDGGVPARSGTASIVVRVQDANDNAPKFDRESYTINVTENSPIGSLVVKLNATDLDEGSNSDIAYSFGLYTSEKAQEAFSLSPNTGEIRVKETINYEDFRIYNMEIIAKDKVTIKLSTVETALKSYADMTEVPIEYDIFSDLNLYLVIGLGSVSFLLLITILVTIVLKCQKPKPSKAAPPCRNSVISERNSTIADSTLVSNDAYWNSVISERNSTIADSTLVSNDAYWNSVISERNSTIADSTLVSNDAYWYSLFLAETRKGKLVVRQPVPKGTRYIVSSIPRSTGLTETSDSAASTLQEMEDQLFV
ncbi:hypothetical protein KOW79_012427 [Hemibagrus wyckioides]|uniref:Cadherin domain-containing protein n=1 Tax=Hemibagrus wyckioides TaxID=337641 RepID=A0A9D3SHD4_9TELE|nr:hypothetical protein KOW79_012427 [Hemibagrus wyckioides]